MSITSDINGDMQINFRNEIEVPWHDISVMGSKISIIPDYIDKKLRLLKEDDLSLLDQTVNKITQETISDSNNQLSVPANDDLGDWEIVKKEDLEDSEDLIEDAWVVVVDLPLPVQETNKIAQEIISNNLISEDEDTVISLLEKNITFYETKIGHHIMYTEKYGHLQKETMKNFAQNLLASRIILEKKPDLAEKNSDFVKKLNLLEEVNVVLILEFLLSLGSDSVEENPEFIEYLNSLKEKYPSTIFNFVLLQKPDLIEGNSEFIEYLNSLKEKYTPTVLEFLLGQKPNLIKENPGFVEYLNRLENKYSPLTMRFLLNQEQNIKDKHPKLVGYLNSIKREYAPH